jgi:hypothetical protein
MRRARSSGTSGSQFTRFTGTKVQILTLERHPSKAASADKIVEEKIEESRQRLDVLRYA